MTWRVVDIIRSSTDFLNKKGVPDARLDAEILLGDVLHKNRLELYLYFDRPLDVEELGRYREHIRRRGTREPLQHILGETGFMDLTLTTGPEALIPRPETEVLVEKVLEVVTNADVRILDIGTGTGCIAIALAQALPQAQILAVDVSLTALKLAQTNNLRNETQVSFQEVDILHNLPHIDQRFNLVVSNPPYITDAEKQDLQAEVLQFDPGLALFDGNDGLSFYRRYAAILPELLQPGGRFYFEFGGQSQKKQILNIFMAAGYHNLEIIQDYNGDPRVIAGRYLP